MGGPQRPRLRRCLVRGASVTSMAEVRWLVNHLDQTQPDGGGGCGRQDNGPPRDVHDVIPETREYVRLRGKGSKDRR